MSSESPDGRVVATRGAWLDVHSPEPTTQVQGRKRERRVNTTSLMFVLAVLFCLVGLAVSMQLSDYDVWGAFLVGPVLLMLVVPIATRIAKWDRDPRVGRLILLAAVVKLVVGTGARFIYTTVLYRGGDAASYLKAGIEVAPQFQHLDFSALGVVGTHFIEGVTGLIIAVISETSLGAYAVYSWFAFVGLCCFYLAFRIAFPEGNHRRYRLLLFFWPSTIFWPSSVGKDAFMVMVIGMSALGVANLLVGRFRGFVWLAIGTLGCVMVRPHLSLMVVAGFAIALLLRRNRGTYTRMLARPLGTAILMVGLILASLVLFAQAQSFLQLDSLNLESTQAVLDSTTGQTNEGGSSFAPASPTTPIGYLEGAVTVLLRPFPFELPIGIATFSGIEGVLMGVLMILSWRRLLRVPRMMLRNAYVAFAVGYTAAFIFGFSSISNFGILARERVQLLPILFVLFSVPVVKRGEKAVDEEAAEEPKRSWSKLVSAPL